MYRNDDCVNNPGVLNQAVGAIRQDREGVIGLVNGGLEIPVLSIHCMIGFNLCLYLKGIRYGQWQRLEVGSWSWILIGNGGRPLSEMRFPILSCQ